MIVVCPFQAPYGTTIILRKNTSSLAVKCKSEENCAFDDKSTIFGTEIIEILKNIF